MRSDSKWDFGERINWAASVALTFGVIAVLLLSNFKLLIFSREVLCALLKLRSVFLSWVSSQLSDVIFAGEVGLFLEF
jgi:hypothetical protein